MIPFTTNDVLQLQALVSGRPVPGSVTGIRDLSGAGNNLSNPSFGAADSPFVRLTAPSYGAFESPSAPEVAPSQRQVNPIFAGLDPRAISNAVSAQTVDTPKAASGVNMMFSAFGQYFDHGLTASPKGGSGVLEIGAPGIGRGPGSDNPADLVRSTVAYLDANGTPVHLNNTSAYVDQNQAYGAHGLVGTFLRAPDGHGGVGAKLMTGRPDPINPKFDQLPTLREMIAAHWENNTAFNVSGAEIKFRDAYPNLVSPDGSIDATVAKALYTNFLGSGQPLLTDLNPFISPLDHIVGGDGRINENVTLTALHTIWARNHNVHVDGLLAAGFSGTQENLYQAAKIVNETEYQRIIFTEFADVLLGGMRGSGSHGHDEYAPRINAGISQEFAAAAYRFGHSLVGQTVQVVDASLQVREITLFDAFLNPSNEVEFSAPIATLNARGYFPQPGYAQLGVDGIIAGIVAQPAEEVDANVVDALRNDLVRVSADLFALNVARGRDLGLGTINHVRQQLLDSTDPYVRDTLRRADLDLTPYDSWEDFQQRNQLSDATIQRLVAAYPDLVLTDPQALADFVQFNPSVLLVNGNTVKGIDRLDLWVGGLMESHVNGGVVGSTFWVIIHEQLDRLQEADRFYYFDRVDNFDFYSAIEDAGFAAVLARTTGWTYGGNVFLTSPVPVDSINPVDPVDPGEPGNPVVPAVPPSAEPVDTTGPLVLNATFSSEAGLGAGRSVRLEFSEDVRWVAGAVELWNEADEGPVEGDGLTELVLGENVSVAGNVITIRLPSDLDGGTPYSLELIAGSVADMAGNLATGGWSVRFETSPDSVGTDGDDVLRGSLNADLLMGGRGDDWLIGRAGNDTLDGGRGSDTLSGGLGDDVYVVDTAGDLVLEGWTLDPLTGLPVVDALTGNQVPLLTQDAADRIDTTLTTFSLNGHDFIEQLAFIGTGNFRGTGNDLDNVITGGAGNDNLQGGVGLDVLHGGLGNDTLGGGADNDTLNGDAGNDSLVGGAGNDQLNGGEGNDRLIGSTGADTLRGGAGADVFVLSAAADSGTTAATRDLILDFEAGIDKIDVSAIDARPGGQINAFTWIGNAQFSAQGQLRYRVDGNTVVVEANTNNDNGTAEFSIALSGPLGATLQATDFVGVTIPPGGGGNQPQGPVVAGLTLTGTRGANTLTGANGADTLNGDRGNDTLIGGLGNDTLTGGRDNDVFVFNTTPGAGNVDTITDFSVPQDTIWLAASVFTGIGVANAALAATAFHVGAAAADAADRIIYNSATGALSWDADGSGAGAAVQFAQLATGLAMTNQDFRVI